MGKKKGGNPGGPSGEQAPQQQRQQQPPQQHQQQQGGQRGPPGGGGGHQGGGGGRGGGNQGGRGGGQQGEDRSRGGGHQGGRGGGQQGGRGGGQQGGRGGGQQGGRGGGQQGGRGGGQQGGRGGGQQGGRGGGQLGEGRGGGYQGEDGRGRGGAPWGRGGRGGEGHQGGGRGRGQDGTGDQQSVARAPPQQSQFPQQGDPCRQSTPPQAPLQQAPPQPVQTTPSPSASSTSSKGDAASLVSQTTSLSLGISSEQWSKAVMPLRESRNKAPKVGRPITVETNHLKLAMVNSKAVVFHYDVTFVPEKPFRFCRPAMEQIKRKHYPDRHPAFDGKKNLYSFTRLPLQDDILREKVVIFDDERQAEKEIEVKVQMVNSVDMTSISEYLKSGSSLNPPQEAIQALDIVLRQPAMTGFTQVRRSYFTPPSGQAFRLGGGLDLWYGFFQSAILGARPFVNIDVAHKGFPASVNCIQAIEDIINEGQRSYGPQQQQQRIRLNPNSPIENYVIEKFTSLVKGLKVVYRKPVRQSGQAETRTYKVHNVGESARDKRFRKEGGQLISVEEYFQNEYRVRLDFPNAPCLIVGSLEKPLSLPAELCTIAKGQVINRQMDEIQTRNMVQQAARPPPERKSRIMDSLTQLRINENPCVREFGLSVEPRFLQVQGRVLSAPKLQYGDRTVPAARGEWRAEKFIMAKSLDNWVIYHSRVRDNDIQQLWRGFISSGQQLGMRVSQPNVVEKRRIDADFQTFKKNGAQLVVVIIPDFDRTGEFTYAKVKRIAETQVGVLTQCLRNRTMRKLSPPTLVNILLKVNAKLNGVNHNIERGVWPKFLERPVMVVGADVTHPAPTSDPSKPPTVPSVAAVAASHDPNAFKYNMLWRLQPAREEMITELEAIMKEQLMFFYKANNGLKPEAIYFYRDGVSEGQFQKVLQIEVNAVKRACKALSFGDPYEPPITFLVVQKRHHTRFFPTRREDEEGKNRNVPAGTVVDTTIVHPRELDFYLVSHASIQGTARPTKYHLLYEDLPMAEATLEEITYYLCHLFTRCTRSVSYPAPTYYAHLAAFRIRHYLEREMVRMDRLPDLQNSLQIKQFLSVDHPMFFV